MSTTVDAALVRNILIVKFGALGDVVRTAYVLPALAERYPEARIYWLTADSALELLRFNPFIYGLVSPGAGFGTLKNITFDLVISLDDEREVLERLESLRTVRVVGARLENGSRTYCDASAAWFDMGLISRHGKARADELKRLNQREHHMFLGEMAGVSIKAPSFFNSAVLERHASLRFDEASFHVGLNSGSGARWPSKQLRLEEAVLLAQAILAIRVDGCATKLWLLGGREEAARHAEICAKVASPRLIDPGSDQSIGEFAAWIKALDYLITSDSLAVHLGISQHVPNLSFYAPTSAAEIGTFGGGVKVVSTAPDYCNYRPDADNSSITASRIMDTLQDHLQKRGHRVEGGA